MTPFRSTRRVLASSASLFVPEPPLPGTGCMLCLWESGKNELQPISVPGAGTCMAPVFTQRSLYSMFWHGDSLYPRRRPHPGHVSLVVSAPSDPSSIRYFSLGAADIDKATALKTAYPLFSPELGADLTSFGRLPDQVLPISFVNLQPVYDWVESQFHAPPAYPYHMLGGAKGHSCATACRTALQAGDSYMTLGSPRIITTPQSLFAEVAPIQAAHREESDMVFAEQQLKFAMDAQHQIMQCVPQRLKAIIDTLKSINTSNSPVFQQSLEQVIADYEILVPLFLGQHSEMNQLPPNQPIHSIPQLIGFLETITLRESYLINHFCQKNLDQFRILTYTEQHGSGPIPPRS